MPAERLRAVVRMVSLLAFEAVVVASLYLVGRTPSVGVDWSDPAGWLAVTPIDQVLVSMVWLAAVVMACWMLGSTLLYLAARSWGLRRVLPVAERLVAPAVRRVVDRALAATLVGTVLLGPAAPAFAAPPDPFDAMTTPSQSEYEPQPAGSEPPVSAPGPPRKAPEPVEQPPDDENDAEGERQRSRTNEQAGNNQQTGNDDKESGVSTGAEQGGKRERSPTPDTEDPAGQAETEGDQGDGSDEPRGGGAEQERPDAPRDREQEQPDAPREAARTPGAPRPGHGYTVRVGDHLWKIATEVVAGGDGTADRAAVASYWADLVREATPGLRSGNPDLIYPGEQITLPQLADRAREEP